MKPRAAPSSPRGGAILHGLDETWRQHNQLLALLSVKDFLHISPFLTVCEVGYREVVAVQGRPFGYVDFPCTSVYALLLTMEDGRMVEVGTVGNEGVSAVSPLVDGDVSTATIACQVPGVSMRMDIAHFEWELESNPVFRTVLNLYAQAYLSLSTQSLACGKLHALEQRAARWLLMTQDRARQEEFPLTQEAFAMMLGAQRPTISHLARKFEQAGAIQYARGKVRVCNRDMLCSLACECYAASRRQFERLLGVSIG